MPPSKILNGMIRTNTPLEDHTARWKLWVKREDKSCVPPGPAFSKARGVFAHIAKRSEQLIGVLDTYHSQAGHAVARACQVLGKECLNFYPEFVHEPGHRKPQERSSELGASLFSLKAGRSAVLFHQAKKITLARSGYMMPNALKLEESVEETAKEVNREVLAQNFDCVLIPASSGTIASGVIRGFDEGGQSPLFMIHLGYKRSHKEVIDYVRKTSGVQVDPVVIDEDYQYKDKSVDGPSPDWPCNEYYDLKAFRWWMAKGIAEGFRSKVLFWNIG